MANAGAAEVVLLQGVPRPLTYLVPEPLAELRPGDAVRVPLGKTMADGYLLRRLPQAPAVDYTLKAIGGLAPALPALPERHLRFVLRAAEYYRVAPGEILALALPPAARGRPQRWSLTDRGRAEAPSGSLQRALATALAQRPQSTGALSRLLARPLPAVQAALRRMQDAGLVACQRLERPAEGRHLITLARLPAADPAALESLERRAPRALALYRLLPEDGRPVALAGLAQRQAGARGAAATLVGRGLASLGTAIESPDGALRPIVAPTESGLIGAAVVELNADQRAAREALVAALGARAYAAFLLQGVTGSGKTEVYLRAIDDARARGLQALVLVPEIALTPQLQQRFVLRFGERAVGIWHSELSFGQRRRIWDAAASGQLEILLGARSALFVPLPRLGLVVVDEEHDGSYKQDETPRYHGRDLALLRAQLAGAVAVLGSATPALESLELGKTGKLAVLSLPRRATAQPLPSVEPIDLRTEPRSAEALLGRTLVGALTDTVAAGRQAILFLNRRGFAPYVLCGDCGHAFVCEQCAVSLTLHLRRALLLCHYCGYEQPIPQRCPACQHENIRHLGLGTERLEEALVTLLPGARLARLDRDTVGSRRRLEETLVDFARGRTDVLLGTQMVTKGHDFPGVTLVGVVNADAALNFPDFRAAERAFQLITQVAGRAGRRGEAGRVLVQTYNPTHYAIAAACRHDYEAFAAQELELRRQLRYPPYGHLALVRVEDLDQGRAEAAARECAARLQASAGGDAAAGEVAILGPAPAPLARLRGRYRQQVLIKAATRQALRRAVGASLAGVGGVETRVILDIDPLNML